MSRTVRSLGLAGAAGVVVVGALVPLAAVVLAGGDGPVGWVVVAGAAACASGLAFGTTQRVLPALGLAVVAAADLAIAATARDEEPVRELAFPARGEVAGEQKRSRGNLVVETARERPPAALRPRWARSSTPASTP